MCSKALQPSSLVDVFETFLSSAATTVDEEKGNPLWQPCADFYIACILSCLPWGGAELVEVILLHSLHLIRKQIISITSNFFYKQIIFIIKTIHVRLYKVL
jgi:hypothetical protein